MVVFSQFFSVLLLSLVFLQVKSAEDNPYNDPYGVYQGEDCSGDESKYGSHCCPTTKGPGYCRCDSKTYVEVFPCHNIIVCTPDKYPGCTENTVRPGFTCDCE